MMGFIVFAALIGGSFLLYMWIEGLRNDVKKDTVAVKDYRGRKPVTVFFISDIHRRKIHPSIIDQVKGKAEVVIIGGDLAERGVSRRRIADNLRRLREVAPVFFVWGNNDYELPQNEMKSLLAAQDIKVLRNESYRWRTAAGEEIYILGVDDLSKGYSDKKQTFSQVPEGACKIMISHNPLFAKRISDDDRVALFLSGHTHGGQIRLFGMGLYKQGGWKRQGKMWILVSNGYGTSTLPFRLGARAETHLITIVSSN
ncbi:metallophosphoesterase [Bacillus xiapuensis]|uniref:metallophosphoesterase n=1 Tax=Bacillus xiapuensis TaxID=2014075 RepID=UPI000C2454CE|nr:metallophosphoesterase [Bacillus xiapuensis]